MRKLNESERRLVTELGVYGIWILKHGKSLDRQDFLVERICSAYQQYLDSNGSANAARVLLDTIDNFCQEKQFERPGENYDEALKDLWESQAAL